MSSNQRREQELLQKLVDLEEGMQKMHFHIQQQRRLIYQLVRNQGGRVTIKENDAPALWRIHFARVPDGDPDELTISTDMFAEPTPDQLTLLADTLRGTSLRLADALKDPMLAALKDHPPHVLEMMLSQNHIIWADAKWMKAADARALAEKLAKENSQ